MARKRLMRLLLDAHFDPAVAQALRERNHDVVAIQEFGPEMYQAPDTELLAFATAERRTLVTRNVRDFIRLNTVWAAQERSHAGIVFVHAKTIPEGDRGAEIRALEKLLESHLKAADLEDSLLWLRSPK